MIVDGETKEGGGIWLSTVRLSEYPLVKHSPWACWRSTGKARMLHFKMTQSVTSLTCIEARAAESQIKLDHYERDLHQLVTWAIVCDEAQGKFAARHKSSHVSTLSFGFDWRQHYGSCPWRRAYWVDIVGLWSYSRLYSLIKRLSLLCIVASTSVSKSNFRDMMPLRQSCRWRWATTRDR